MKKLKIIVRYSLPVDALAVLLERFNRKARARRLISHLSRTIREL